MYTDYLTCRPVVKFCNFEFYYILKEYRIKVKRFNFIVLQLLLCYRVWMPLQLAQEYSECPSGKKGGDLGWFPRGKMAGPFQDVAFSTHVGATSAPFKSTYGFIISDNPFVSQLFLYNVFVTIFCTFFRSCLMHTS